ncbi:unnamed protein product [Schistosoma margrebowiei]|uniref:Uncharacterized protein n=1 Tax=Schistosoma margrebowiei TaxID=48269 RepID=A0AA85A6R9_9TREM|nr:unnamed protein product [Schistosoma margrebowiei]
MIDLNPVFLSTKLKVKSGGDKNSSFVEEETDWSDWNTIKEYNISGTGGKQEKTMQFTVPQEKGWDVFTEIESEETIIPRTIKITKAPRKEKEDDEDEKPTEAKQTKKPKEEDDDEGPEYERDFQREIRIGRKKKGKKIGEEVSIKLPKQVRKSNDPAFYKN